MRLRIKELRKERNMTVEELAARVRLSKSYVSEIENGKKQCNAARMQAFAAALGVTVFDLLDDATVTGDVAEHVHILLNLTPENRLAVQRHATSLLRQQDEE